MEAHLLLATLAQQVTFSLLPGQPPADFDLEHNLALRPKGRIEVRVHKRGGSLGATETAHGDHASMNADEARCPFHSAPAE
jgi:hypothetical protein